MPAVGWPFRENFWITVKGPREEIRLVSTRENFTEVEMFEFQMRTEQKNFSSDSIGFACHMRNTLLATDKRCEWTSHFIRSRV